MEHLKTFQSIEFNAQHGTFIVEGPVAPDVLANYTLHEDLIAFRPTTEQHQALIDIAKLDEGRIIVIRRNNEIVGYVTYLYPDPLERWAEDAMENLLELGAIEVIPILRGTGAGKKLLEVSFMDNAMEDYIVIATQYYWHWDLKGCGLNAFDYRKMMERMMASQKFEYFATDDPEIACHPANCLMARIGQNIQQDTTERFDALRFKHRFMY